MKNTTTRLEGAILSGLGLIVAAAILLGLAATMLPKSTEEAYSLPEILYREIYYPPEIIYKEITVEKLVAVPYEVPVYIETERVVEVVKEVTVETLVPIKPREFVSLAELELWLAQQPVYFKVDSSGRIDFKDCDDYAIGLQEQALSQGYLMSVQLVQNGRLFGIKVSEALDPHMGNLVIIGNDVYYFERLEFKPVLVARRD